MPMFSQLICCPLAMLQLVYQVMSSLWRLGPADVVSLPQGSSARSPGAQKPATGRLRQVPSRRTPTAPTSQGLLEPPHLQRLHRELGRREAWASGYYLGEKE